MEIEQILNELEYNKNATFARDATRAAQVQRESITPHLIDVIRRATADLEGVIDDYYIAHIYAMYLLAEFRECAAYPIIVDFFRQPGQSSLAVELTGDIVSGELGRMLASVCHGDTSLIEELIADSELDEFVRWAGLIALVTMMASGQLDRQELIKHFRHFYHNLERQPSHVWDGLVITTCDFYGMELVAEMADVFQSGFVQEYLLPPEEVCVTCRTGEQKCLSKLSRSRHYSLIGDTVSEIEHWSCFNEGTEDYSTLRPPVSVPPNAYDPHPYHASPKPVVSKRKTGRNERCPCGSGKKFKRCCG